MLGTRIIMVIGAAVGLLMIAAGLIVAANAKGALHEGIAVTSFGFGTLILICSVAGSAIVKLLLGIRDEVARQRDR